MQIISYFDRVPKEIIGHQIIEELSPKALANCLTLSKFWSQLVIESNNFQDIKAIHEWPQVVEIPKNIINIFGSIAKIHQVPLLILRTSRTILSDGFQGGEREIMEQGINAQGVSTYQCNILPLDQVNKPIMYWMDSLNRPNCLFKVKYSNGEIQQKKMLIHFFRTNVEGIDHISDEEFLNTWKIHCYSQNQSYELSVQKFVLENEPFEILNKVNTIGSFSLGLEKLEIDN